ncbi:MAG: hypothetical protein MI974_27875 [Chitinophagales bacterium]|nr:hypothetical protein [Chitinophagales bacterium]
MFTFLKSFIHTGSKEEFVQLEAHYNVYPKDAFRICLDFEAFLKINPGLSINAKGYL